MTPEPPWKPSRREQHLLWWLQMAMRFGVGGGGLVWCLVVNRLSDPVSVIVFGALATSTDVISFARALIRQARQDTMVMDEAINQEEARRDDTYNDQGGKH